MDISVPAGQLPADLQSVGVQLGDDFTAYEAILSMLLLLQMHLGHNSLAFMTDPWDDGT